MSRLINIEKCPFRIGGPGTWLPSPVESFLSWCLCLSCLSVSGYNYLKTRYFSQLPVSSYQISLTTHSIDEVGRCSLDERHCQLISMINILLGKKEIDFFTCDEKVIVNLLRSNDICRRLASLVMKLYMKNGNNIETRDKGEEKYTIVPKLKRVWDQLLEIPSFKDNSEYKVSLIVPAYRENVELLHKNLEYTLSNCQSQSSIELILVHALPSNKDDNQLGAKMKDMVESLRKSGLCGQSTYVAYSMGGGRGPCLNYGAKVASGNVFTFCHADTTLPKGWDEQVMNTLQNDKKASCCTFSFGIGEKNSSVGKYPPGIRAVEYTANLRTNLFSLPYGDQVLSMHQQMFRFIGGFPDQCLMEDYELVTLLRKRKHDHIAIIPNHRALCSPRRWQKFGVLYVTFMNSIFVNYYVRYGMTPNELYQLYYNTSSPPKRKYENLSPWEVTMHQNYLIKKN
jgi:glycosyltransferase involved in cell wall biosynthesis